MFHKQRPSIRWHSSSSFQPTACIPPASFSITSATRKRKNLRILSVRQNFAFNVYIPPQFFDPISKLLLRRNIYSRFMLKPMKPVHCAFWYFTVAMGVHINTLFSFCTYLSALPITNMDPTLHVALEMQSPLGWWGCE